MSIVESVSTPAAPAAIGPYAQATAAGGMIFCSGQIGLSPEDGALVEGGVAAETRQALLNLSAVLKASGASFGDVTKTTLYLVQMSDFAVVNEIYAEFLGESRPARATVAVCELPKGALFEIDAIACLR
ncbi:MAG: Rid family detoxifying hydrolase [Candidatus Binatia bacterium]|nr:Rid family detoxifying hydrolase [Candidatus Binatia bacterium]MDG2011472.1 Rid family detoxifying hydrolase [Candidatus Binatia bacterium]HAC80107.1 deaminase [Deltaproteobacteria bacterium]